MNDHSELKRLAEAFPTDLDWDSNTEPFFNGPSGESLGGGATGFYSVYGKPFRLEGEDYDYDGPTYVEACNADFAKFMVAARDGVLSLIAENKRLAELLECAQGDCRQAMQIIEKLTPEADLYQQIQIAAGSLPSSWEISLRVENGYGGVDLIDPHGTVVDLDDVDSTLGESVAGAVAFAIAKEASHG